LLRERKIKGRLYALWLFVFNSAASLVAQTVKKPAMQETWVRSLGQEDPLEKGMVTHFRVAGWRIPWREDPGVL